MFIPLDLLHKNDACAAWSPEEIAARKRQIQTKSAMELDGSQMVAQRAAMLHAVAPEDFEEAFERYIGGNDLLPINYLQIGMERSRAVGRLRFFDRMVGRPAMASGFLISPDLVLTNHHVFKGPDTFKDAFIDFDYAYDVGGHEQTRITFRLDAGKFFYTDEKLDCAIIGIAELDETQTHRVVERGWLTLDPGVGKAGVGDYASIIQYPDGNYQQVALRGNQILEIQPTALVYVTDTSPGSSGSPAFNDEWQVIALHSAGVAKKDAQGRYIDKDGVPIPVVNKHIDATRVVWTSNTGIRVSALMADWMTRPELLKSPYAKFLTAAVATGSQSPAARVGAPAAPDSSANESLQTSNSNTMTTTHEADRPAWQGLTINIHVNAGGLPAATVCTAVPAPPPPPSLPAAITPPPTAAGPVTAALESFESKTKDSLEQSQDYSTCTGFDNLFMGQHTPLPTLGTQLARKAAPLLANAKNYVLSYDHYSTIVHAVRCMPMVSAINVEGDPVVRQDDTPRKDNWLRDNRIDMDVQLTDDYYKLSGFDKGHMSRREDAKWGKDAATAEEAAQMTCMYTNACPQVPAINRAIYGYHGLWGQLEQIVLEKGAEAESGEASKICVYNGPIFVDTDPVYKAVQVPMSFFKIIVWRNDAGEFKTTGFVLSQQDLVGDIQFEELQYDKQFIEHQCSIAYIEKLTDMVFTVVNEWDTSPNKGDATAVETVDRAAVEAHVSGHAQASGTKTAAKKSAVKKSAVKSVKA